MQGWLVFAKSGDLPKYGGMNYPLPAGMPWAQKADIMVRRGEARSFREACSIMAQRANRSRAAKAQSSVAQQKRLPNESQGAFVDPQQRARRTDWEAPRPRYADD